MTFANTTLSSTTDPVAETDFFIARETGGFDKYPVNAGDPRESCNAFDRSGVYT
jgi:hypothetical protein